MLSHELAPHPKIYRVQGDGGRRYVIYNAAAIGNPFDHQPDKWYFRPYPVPLGLEAGEPYETAADAERAARAGVM